LVINPEIAKNLGNRVRIRVCGLLIVENRILLINHAGLYGHDFWSFPGGGLEYGHSTQDTLVREFKEECNLEVEPGDWRFSCQIVKPPLHAIELCFGITKHEGIPKAGYDPERGNNQIISDLRFFTWEEVLNIPKTHCHPIFRHLDHPADIQVYSGFFTASNK